MRLEITRDAFEDYDLLTLLERRIRAIRQDPDLQAHYSTETMDAALGALATWPLIHAVDDFEKDPAPYEAAHQALLRALASLA
jgi:hypothetical protein